MSICRIVGCLGSIGNSKPLSSLEKSRLYTSYCVTRIDSQIVKGGSLPYSLNTSPILGELLEFAEMSMKNDRELGKEWALSIVRALLSLLNSDRIERAHERLIWNCLILFISKTRLAVDVIHLACQAISSVEQMAFVIELCIERHAVLGGMANEDIWAPIVEVLATPELVRP